MSSEPLTSSTAPAPPRRARRRWFWMTIVVAVIALGIGLSAWFWPRTPPPEPPLPDLAEVDPEVGDAVAAARDKVRQQPASAVAWGQLGMVLRAHDFGPEARRCFQEAERLDPQEPRWPYLQGVPLLLTDPSVAIPFLERAVERCGDDPSAPRLRLAEALLEQGRLDEAETHLERVRRREPTNLRVYLGLGRLGILRGQWRAALEHLEFCVADEHARKLAHTLRAEAWTQLGEPEKARDEQRQADQAPEDRAWSDPFVEDVLHLRRGLSARLDRAGALFRYQKYSEAVRLLEETVTRYPQSTAPRIQLGDTWRELGQMDRAERVLQEAVQLDPDSAEAWFRLGCVQAALKRPSEAADSFRRTIRLKPDHTLAHYNLGHRLKELGDTAGAADEFRTALRCQPSYGRAQEALRELEKKK